MTKHKKLQHVLVTGASGFIAQHVIALLSQSGYLITALEHQTPLTPAIRNMCHQVLNGSISDSDFINQAMQGIDLVCHLAAYLPKNRLDIGEADQCFAINALATDQLAKAAAIAGVKRFIYMSTAGLYTNHQLPTNEDAAVIPSSIAPYALTSKWTGEVFTFSATEQSSMVPIILRIGVPYGLGEPTSSVVSFFMHQAIKGDTLTLQQEGLASYNYIHVNDVARYVGAALESGEQGIYNITSGELSSLKSLADLIADMYKNEVKLLPADNKSALGFPLVDNNKALKTWDIKPISLKQGLLQYKDSIVS